MAERVETFAVTAPAGTAKATPLEVPIAFDPGNVDRVEIDIPDGHSGFTGLAIALAHQPIIPWGVGQWIIGNDDELRWDLDNYPDSGAWSAFVYNSDTFDHTFYLRFLISELRPNPSGVGLPAVGQPDQVSADASGPGIGDTTGDTPPPDTTPPDDGGGDTTGGGTDTTPPDDGSTDTTTDLPPADDSDLPVDTSTDQTDTVELPPVDDSDLPAVPDTNPDTMTPAELKDALKTCRANYAKAVTRIKQLRKHGAKTTGHKPAAGHGTDPHKPAAGHPHQGGRTGHENLDAHPTTVSGHPELHPGVAQVVNAIRARWPKLQITSTTGGNHVAHSFHYLGEACDLAVGMDAEGIAYMHEAAVWIDQNLRQYLTEGIHNTGLSVKDSKEVPPSFWGTAIWAEHANHIHVARAGGPVKNQGEHRSAATHHAKEKTAHKAAAADAHRQANVATARANVAAPADRPIALAAAESHKATAAHHEAQAAHHDAQEQVHKAELIKQRAAEPTHPAPAHHEAPPPPAPHHDAPPPAPHHETPHPAAHPPPAPKHKH